MKKNIFLSLALILSLSSCGDSSNNSSVDLVNGIVENKITGKVIDGYIADSVVCLDINSNLLCEDNEPNSKTDINGNFTLTIDNSNKLTNIIAYGGYDISTKKRFRGKLIMEYNEDINEYNISPMTTLITEIAETSKISFEEAHNKLKLKLDVTEYNLTEDPLLSDDKIFLLNIELQKTIEVLSASRTTTFFNSSTETSLYKEIAKNIKNENVENILEIIMTMDNISEEDKLKIEDFSTKLHDLFEKTNNNIGPGATNRSNLRKYRLNNSFGRDSFLVLTDELVKTSYSDNQAAEVELIMEAAETNNNDFIKKLTLNNLLNYLGINNLKDEEKDEILANEELSKETIPVDFLDNISNSYFSFFDKLYDLYNEYFNENEIHVIPNTTSLDYKIAERNDLNGVWLLNDNGTKVCTEIEADNEVNVYNNEKETIEKDTLELEFDENKQEMNLKLGFITAETFLLSNFTNLKFTAKYSKGLVYCEKIKDLNSCLNNIK